MHTICFLFHPFRSKLTGLLRAFSFTYSRTMFLNFLIPTPNWRYSSGLPSCSALRCCGVSYRKSTGKLYRSFFKSMGKLAAVNKLWVLPLFTFRRILYLFDKLSKMIIGRNRKKYWPCKFSKVQQILFPCLFHSSYLFFFLSLHVKALKRRHRGAMIGAT